MLAGADIAGSIAAGRSLGQSHAFGNDFGASASDSVFAYGDINASISALNSSGTVNGGAISGVGAIGPISGPINATGNLGGVRSGDKITATSANVPSVSTFDTTLASLTAPSIPASAAAGILSDVAAALTDLQSDHATVMAELATSLADAATAQATTITDVATAQADHATQRTDLLASAVAAVASDQSALQAAFATDEAAATQALQDVVNATTGGCCLGLDI